jgi:hypothetical protein
MIVYLFVCSVWVLSLVFSVMRVRICLCLLFVGKSKRTEKDSGSRKKDTLDIARGACSPLAKER